MTKSCIQEFEEPESWTNVRIFGFLKELLKTNTPNVDNYVHPIHLPIDLSMFCCTIFSFVPHKIL